MRYDIETIRAFGSQRVVMRTSDGIFTGRFAPEFLRERAILVLFRTASESEPLAIDLERIEDVSLDSGEK